jgi:hypothetical protein
MKLTVRFPVINDIKINESWSVVKGNKRLFLELEDGWLREVLVTFEKLPESIAPSVNNNPQNDVAAEITFRCGTYILEAERFIRAWQTILTPYVLIEIDFDRVGQTYTPEPGEDTKIHAFSKSRRSLRNFGSEAFEVFAGAFLAAESAMSSIEEVSFYREAEIARRSGRFVDAYNGFFLFLETKIGEGKFKERDLIRLFLANGLLMNALREDLRQLGDTDNSGWPNLVHSNGKILPEEEIVGRIIRLRGKLRHHSLSNPNRWDPNKQNGHADDASFLGRLCFHIAFNEVTSKIWREEIRENFARQAKENRMTTRVITTVSIQLEDTTQDRIVPIEVPQKTLDGALAKHILKTVINEIEAREPAAQILAIRAETDEKREEIFRYDLGPKLLR